MAKQQQTASIVTAQQARPVRAVRIGVIGLGTVGMGTVKVLLEHQREVERRLGCRLELKVICSRSIHQRDLPWITQPVEKVTDWKEVVKDPEVDIVVTLVGKLETEHAIALAALEARKHLVTANKQLVAEHGVELVGLSHQAGTSPGIE